jgi:hypothetical protein
MQKRGIKYKVKIPAQKSGKPHFKELKILTLPSLYIYHLCIYIFDNKNEFATNAQIHGHNTRQRVDVHLLRHNTSIYNKSPFHVAIKVFNNLPSVIKNCIYRASFTRKLKDFLLKKAYYSVQDYLEESLGC